MKMSKAPLLPRVKIVTARRKKGAKMTAKMTAKNDEDVNVTSKKTKRSTKLSCY